MGAILYGNMQWWTMDQRNEDIIIIIIKLAKGSSREREIDNVIMAFFHVNITLLTLAILSII